MHGALADVFAGKWVRGGKPVEEQWLTKKEKTAGWWKEGQLVDRKLAANYGAMSGIVQGLCWPGKEKAEEDEATSSAVQERSR